MFLCDWFEDIRTFRLKFEHSGYVLGKSRSGPRQILFEIGYCSAGLCFGEISSTFM